jgi:hypothetical protein
LVLADASLDQLAVNLGKTQLLNNL